MEDADGDGVPDFMQKSKINFDTFQTFPAYFEIPIIFSQFEF